MEIIENIKDKAGISNGSAATRTGIALSRVFSVEDVHPYDQIQWNRRSATITNDKGETIFEQKDVEVPAAWSMLAVNVVVSKYFHGPMDADGDCKRETSIKQLIDRVVMTLCQWAREGRYFASCKDLEIFEAELTYLLVNQHLSFNSPVWFNLGTTPQPQCSACFINSVQDNMKSILDLARTEGLLFKWGSGTGTNLSPLRASRERLSSGGWASGPVSFMRGYDAFAGVIKSGGKTRRAAKMVILDVEHPDIMEFIHCKRDEERKAWALIHAGYDGSFDGEAYRSVFFQNSNNSVRVSDAFMRAVEEDARWHTKARTDGNIVNTYRAREIMDHIVEAVHACGDPGLQFDTTINDWHTCAGSGRINASNPCSEYMFLDDSACNLASINLMKFRRDDGSFAVEEFRQACRISILAQEIMVDNASYPTEKITVNSHRFRPLGLGYANLGALLMSKGLPYNSPGAHAYAAAVTAIMTGEAYRTSAEIASHMGPFPAYDQNRTSTLAVIRKHRSAVGDIDADKLPARLLDAATRVWDEALAMGNQYGYRNAQVTVLAPTGTIGFMMDCDTTGIEPDIALVKYKNLSGGGVLKIVNQTVPMALRELCYRDQEITEIVDYIDSNETIEGAPHIQNEHLAIFDCAFKPAKGSRFIHHMGHVYMMAAVQPFLSGAISKTVNMPESSTPEDIKDTYMQAWKLGLKAVAIYRDGSKRVQPLSVSSAKDKEDKPEETPASSRKLIRKRLPDERQSITHKFSVGGHEGYLTVGMYEDGAPGEIFVVMAKEGSVISGLMDTIATATSIALQYGVPLEVLTSKFRNTRFEPSGFTNNREIPMAKSVIDYIFRWLDLKFNDGTHAAIQKKTASHAEVSPSKPFPKSTGAPTETDAPPCSECGCIMTPNGSCYKCGNCGATSGCS